MSELKNAIRQVCEDKGLTYESVISTIELALAAAYRKDFGSKGQNIQVEFNPDTAATKVYDVKTVVEDMPEESEEESLSEEPNEDDGEEKDERRFNPKTEIQISEAKKIKKSYKIGDEIRTKLEVPSSYGRMAAQTAKQVIIQKLREAERENVFNEFKDKEHEVVSGVVQRREGRSVLVDLGKSTGILIPEEQVRSERYNPGDRIKIYVKEVRLGSRGAEIILSRTSEEILKKVFYLEIPEISNGLVEIKAVAREAGSRSKIAVFSDSENVDPIGSCVGQKGSRIQTIISELGGEKVDIILYDDDPSVFIANALSPAKVLEIETKEERRKAIVKVAFDQLSLAIGKDGQNARLAARLTGWKIDIVDDGQKNNHEKDGESEEKSEKKEEDEGELEGKKTSKEKTE